MGLLFCVLIRHDFVFCALVLYEYHEVGLKCKNKKFLVCKIHEPQTVLQEGADIKFTQQLLFQIDNTKFNQNVVETLVNKHGNRMFTLP